MRSRRLLATAILALAFAAEGADSPPPAPRDADLVVGLPLLRVVRFPSVTSQVPTWDAAVETHADLFLLSHYLVERSTESIPIPWLKRASRIGGAFLLDALSWFIINPGWAHEEGHRSVLGQYSIASHNGANDPPGTWTGGYIPVYGMTDDALAGLKRDHPADMVRLQSAGWESEILVRAELERITFFHARPGYEVPLYALFSNVSIFGYLDLCLNQAETASMVAQEVAATGGNMFLRDFTGPDCTGWAYDLQRPDEPYAARGTDATGLIRRPRLPSDMTAAELAVLRRQRNLSLLNLVDPNLLGLTSFTATDPFTKAPFRWSFSVQHVLTSFGGTTGLNFFFAEGDLRLRAELSLGGNGRGYYFPGLVSEIYRYPVRVPWGTLWSSGSVGLWLQPQGQRFDSGTPVPGAMLTALFAQRVFPPVEATLRLTAKTAGWAPGIAELGPMVDVTLGLGLALE